MKDIEYDPDEETAYECFKCGNIVMARDNPVTCSDCGGDMRHRQTPLE